MKKLIVILLSLSPCSSLMAQNLFPQVVKACNPNSFCLDCGDVKTNYDPEEFNKVKLVIEQNEKFKDLQGKIIFQLILRSGKKACVLSHTDETNSPLTQELIKMLNNFDGWIAPIFEGNKEEFVSFNFSVTILNGVIQGEIERVDMQEFAAGFDHPQDPEIDNVKYLYKNENLKDYSFQIWNTKNSENPNNMNDAVTISTVGDIWYTIDEGLYRFDGNSFFDARQTLTKPLSYFTYYTVAADRKGRTWVSTTEGLYCFEKQTWKKYDSLAFGFKDINRIVINKHTDEVFFCSDNGLFIYDGNVWKTINRKNTKQLPSDRIAFAKRDSKNRIWIGTYEGSLLIDENETTAFNKISHVLKNECIISLDEDESGTLYMGIYDYRKKGGEKTNDGIVSLNRNTQWKHYTSSNSGLPVNNTEDLIVDNENVVWIVTATAGLVRFDPSLNQWENYHNKNSDLPTSYISDIDIDKRGNLILGTRQGLVRVSKK